MDATSIRCRGLRGFRKEGPPSLSTRSFWQPHSYKQRPCCPCSLCVYTGIEAFSLLWLFGALKAGVSGSDYRPITSPPIKVNQGCNLLVSTVRASSFVPLLPKGSTLNLPCFNPKPHERSMTRGLRCAGVRAIFLQLQLCACSFSISICIMSFCIHHKDKHNTYIYKYIYVYTCKWKKIYMYVYMRTYIYSCVYTFHTSRYQWLPRLDLLSR